MFPVTRIVEFFAVVRLSELASAVPDAADDTSAGALCEGMMPIVGLNNTGGDKVPDPLDDDDDKDDFELQPLLLPPRFSASFIGRILPCDLAGNELTVFGRPVFIAGCCCCCCCCCNRDVDSVVVFEFAHPSTSSRCSATRSCLPVVANINAADDGVDDDATTREDNLIGISC